MDLRLGRSEPEPTYWPVLSDLSITVLLILMLFLALNVLATFSNQRRDLALQSLSDAVTKDLRSVADSSHLRIKPRVGDHQRVTFAADLLFPTCKASLQRSGQSEILDVGKVLKKFERYLESVNVEGHTDARPVTSAADCPFRSNWELSSARATSVVQLLSDSQFVPGNRLAATGRSQYRPVDPQNWTANRRVEIELIYNGDSAIRRLDSLKAVVGRGL